MRQTTPSGALVTVHRPVLLEAVLEALVTGDADGWFVDATYGRGGHSRGLLERVGPRARLLALDQDPEAVRHGQDSLGSDPRVVIRHGNFESLASHVREVAGDDPVRGVLMDLGVSSPQLDTAERGFSFQADGPLDMRMDTTRGESAAEWLADASEADIARVLWRYGEERHGRRIARAIVRARAEAPIGTTRRLAEVVAAAVPDRHGARRHPATRSFQAIRIHVNRELEVLDRGLEQAVEVLAPGGRLAVISFHSLEDRAVKRYLRRLSEPDPVYRGLPDMPAHARPTMKLVGRARRAAEAEVAANPRARSATLRVAEKC